MTNTNITEAASGATAPGTLSQAATTDGDILAALAKLDPKNDDHWTKSGDVSMEAINALLPAPITRARLNEVAPNTERPRESAPQTQPPIDNEHVADGATQFTEEEIEANAGKMPAGGIGSWVAPPGTTLTFDNPADDESPTIDPRDARIAALEDDVAFLRGIYGWPTKDA